MSASRSVTPQPPPSRRDDLGRALFAALAAKSANRSIESALGDLAVLTASPCAAMARGIAEPASTGSSTWGGALAGEAILDALVASRASIVARLAMPGALLDDDARVIVPARLGSGSVAQPAEEGGSIIVGDPMLNVWHGEAHKVAAITAAPRSLLRKAGARAYRLLVDALVADLASALDALLLDDGAATAARPAGLVNIIGAGNVKPANGTDGAALIKDALAAADAILADGFGGRLAILCHERWRLRMASATDTTGRLLVGADGTLGGVPIIASTHAARGHVVVVDLDALPVLLGAPEVAVSTQAILATGKQAPIVGGASGPTAVADVASPVVSLFQLDAMAVRSLAPAAWTLRDARAARAISVAWA